VTKGSEQEGVSCAGRSPWSPVGKGVGGEIGRAMAGIEAAGEINTDGCRALRVPVRRH
jgi:hypothetical protein